VYRPSTGGNWQQYNGKDWNTVPRQPPSTSAPPAESPASLSRERQARKLGDYRARPQPAPKPASPPPPRSAPKPPPPRPH
jgi:hypothetical protein